MKKKSPDFTVIDGGKADPKPSVTFENVSMSFTEDRYFTEETSIRDIINQWKLALTRDYNPSDDFVFVSSDFPGMDLLSSNVSITATFSYDGPRGVTANTWTELADLVDRWRAARDEFTLVALDQELRDWLDRK